MALVGAGYPNDSIWFGRDIKERVLVEWGRHSLVDATRALLRKACQFWTSCTRRMLPVTCDQQTLLANMHLGVCTVMVWLLAA